MSRILACSCDDGQLSVVVDEIHFRNLFVNLFFDLLVYAVSVDPYVLEPEGQGGCNSISDRLRYLFGQLRGGWNSERSGAPDITERHILLSTCGNDLARFAVNELKRRYRVQPGLIANRVAGLCVMFRTVLKPAFDEREVQMGFQNADRFFTLGLGNEIRHPAVGLWHQRQHVRVNGSPSSDQHPAAGK